MARRALVMGIAGQDCAYLAMTLLEKRYEVFGMYRRTSSPNFWCPQVLDSYDRICLISSDVTDMASIGHTDLYPYVSKHVSQLGLTRPWIPRLM